MRPALLFAPILFLCTACPDDGGPSDGGTDGGVIEPTARPLGAHPDPARNAVAVTVRSGTATRITLELYDDAFAAAPVERIVLDGPDGDDLFTATITRTALDELGLGESFLYGFRAFGPNWPYDENWAPGSDAGFVSDVDGQGNRFNPNKLLIDPYGRELSHDPLQADHDWSHYASGPDFRTLDTGPFAPKSVYFDDDSAFGAHVERPLKDDVVYEVHVRGFTKNDPDVPEALRGTYAGAAQKAPYLAALGVTAVEFTPIHEASNDQNDLTVDDANGDNYWGYDTLNYFSPDRRYAADKSWGGPTREFKEMVEAFHNQGIKVFLDVVYNHTAELSPWGTDGDTAPIVSFRGLDNANYFQLGEDVRYYGNHNGVSPNLNPVTDIARDLVVDSIQYWHRVMGVDGYRFDLAALHGNGCLRGCFNFLPNQAGNVLRRVAEELPARPVEGGEGVDLLAEPWGAVGGTYQLGNFPAGWAQWNDQYRDTFRRDMNQLFVAEVTPGDIVTRVAGSSDLFGDRSPAHSINFIVSHDGFTLKDLVSCTEKQNDQGWPFGPSSGGSDNNISWDHGGDEALQRQAVRSLLTVSMVSAGTPMVYGGDERLRSKNCNNNTFNLDNESIWLDWTPTPEEQAHQDFVTAMLGLRAEHFGLRRDTFFTGEDPDENGLKDITWIHDSGQEAWPEFFGDANLHFIGWRIDLESAGESARSMYIGYNGWEGTVTATLPETAAGLSWNLYVDTAAAREPDNALASPEPVGATYDVAGRAVIVLIEE